MTSKAQGNLYVLVWSDDGEVKPVIDDNGRIPVQVGGVDVTIDVNIESQDAPLAVTETSPVNAPFALMHGYDGSNWRKMQQLWGYTDRYAEAEENEDCGTGTNVLTFSTVQPGEVWRVTALTWVNTVSACSVISVQLHDGVNDWTIYTEGTPVADGYISIVCDITMKENDRLRMGFYSCVLHDKVYGWALGYKMIVSD